MNNAQILFDKNMEKYKQSISKRNPVNAYLICNPILISNVLTGYENILKRSYRDDEPPYDLIIPYHFNITNEKYIKIVIEYLTFINEYVFDMYYVSQYIYHNAFTDPVYAEAMDPEEELRYIWEDYFDNTELEAHLQAIIKFISDNDNNYKSLDDNNYYKCCYIYAMNELENTNLAIKNAKGFCVNKEFIQQLDIVPFSFRLPMLD